MAIKGLKDLHYAIIEKEDNEETVYGDVKPLGPARAFNIVPTINRANLHADDAVLFSDASKGATTITLETAYLDADVEADLLGKTVDELGGVTDRSEEHTSELQSRGHLVCRLLLEKKKKNKK